MRLRELEARVLKLERDPANSRLGRMSMEELEAETIRLMNQLVADFPTYDAMIEATAAMPDPLMHESARLMRWFLDEHLSLRPQEIEQ